MSLFERDLFNLVIFKFYSEKLVDKLKRKKNKYNITYSKVFKKKSF